MDPLSITAAVISLATRCTATTFELHNAFNHYQNAPQTIAGLEEETGLLKASLNQVQKALQRDPEAPSIADLKDIFNIAVRGTRATLLCLEEEFGKLKERSDWRARIITLWKEDTMKELLEQIQRKKTSIVLFIQCLHMESITDIRRLLQDHRPHFQRAKYDISSLIPTYPHVAVPFLESLDRDTTSSIAGSRDSMISVTEFSFDQEIVNTRVYRETLARLAAKSHGESGRQPSHSRTPFSTRGPPRGNSSLQVEEKFIHLTNDMTTVARPKPLSFANADSESLNVHPQLLQPDVGLTNESDNGSGNHTHQQSQEEARSSSRTGHDPFLSRPTVDTNRLQSQDIDALMEHLSVRDAQRKARDTEIHVTLVRSAAEMRDSYEEIRKSLAEQEVLSHSTTHGSPKDYENARLTAQKLKNALLKRSLKGPKYFSSDGLAKIEQQLTKTLEEIDRLKLQQQYGDGDRAILSIPSSPPQL